MKTQTISIPSRRQIGRDRSLGTAARKAKGTRCSNKSKPRLFIRKRGMMIQPYGQRLEVILTSDLQEACRTKHMRDIYGLRKKDKIGPQTAGLFISNAPCFCIMLLSKGLSLNTIVHECYHATVRISENAGMDQEAHNHEAQAYLNAYIITEVVRAVIKMKHVIRQ